MARLADVYHFPNAPATRQEEERETRERRIGRVVGCEQARVEILTCGEFFTGWVLLVLGEGLETIHGLAIVRYDGPFSKRFGMDVRCRQIDKQP